MVERNKANLDFDVGIEALAHVTEEGRPHLLQEHLEEVGKLAASFAQQFGAGEAARFAGLWHDIGKYSGTFQDMIRRANGFASHIEPENAIGPRDHSTAGAVHASQLAGGEGWPIAFAIAGHHAGLSNLADLQARIRSKEHLLSSAILGGAPAAILDVRATTLTPEFFHTQKEPRNRLRLELWIRMLFSALVDADFLDTEFFYDAARSRQRIPRQQIPVLRRSLSTFLDGLEKNAANTRVNRIRKSVRVACESAASQPPAVFSLSAPTGAGKTLAAMAFALAHAEQHGLHRVVVAVPFTSIIEQNAAVYRNALGGNAVLEHHSSLDPHTETPENRIACENWDAPVVVTTTVQLLESLFAARTSKCRKLHRLAKSVIVLDEVQSLPPALLESIVDVLSTLQQDFGASIVLSTATQPALCSDVVPGGFEATHEILPPSLGLFADLARVAVEWPPAEAGSESYEALSKRIALERSALCIVHRRDDARELTLLLDRQLGHARTEHLSALMCAAHRSKTLARIKKQQGAGKPQHCVSTQLVEAGVDLDFPVVFRALAGLDALAQAAGRCNREGKLDGLGRLVVFRAPTTPPRGVLETAFGVASLMLKSHRELDLFAPETQLEFFSRLYGYIDKDLFDIQAAREKLRFRDVADNFSLIENDWASPLVVPFEDGARRIQEFVERGPSRGRIRALQPYTVNVSNAHLDAWIAQGFCAVLHDTVAVLDELWMPAYDERFGLIPDVVGIANHEDLIL
jgi:CRISPR-associated endonuclease/helicase Cas3